jgi:putative membrane protein
MRIRRESLWMMALGASMLLGTTAWADKTTTTEKTTTSTKTTTAEKTFVEKAASGGMAEVKMGQLAVDKGSSPTVKQFGQKMVDDHSKANDELKAIASKKNLTLPTSLDSKQQATYDKLAKLSGSDFDKAYMEAMVKDHDEDVREFKKASSMSGMDSDLKAWAEKTLGVIEQHDHLAHQDKDAVRK